MICVVGYMPAQTASQSDPLTARRVVDSNFTGCALLLDIARAIMPGDVVMIDWGVQLMNFGSDVKRVAYVPLTM